MGSVSVTEKVGVIHSLKEDTVFVLTEDLAVTNCLKNYFSSDMYFQKSCFFKSAIIISIEVLQPTILSLVLKFFLTLNFQRFTLASALLFDVLQNTGYREINFLLKQLYFQSSINYIQMRTLIWLVQLLPSNNY